MMLLADIPDKLAVTSFIYQMYNYFTKAERSAITKHESLAGDTQKDSGSSPNAVSPFDLKKFEEFRVSPVPSDAPAIHTGMGRYSRYNSKESVTQTEAAGTGSGVVSGPVENCTQEGDVVVADTELRTDTTGHGAPESQPPPPLMVAAAEKAADEPPVASQTAELWHQLTIDPPVVSEGLEQAVALTNKTMSLSTNTEQETTVSEAERHHSPVTMADKEEGEEMQQAASMTEEVEKKLQDISVAAKEKQQASSGIGEVSDQSSELGTKPGVSSKQRSNTPQVTPKTYHHGMLASRGHARCSDSALETGAIQKTPSKLQSDSDKVQKIIIIIIGSQAMAHVLNNYDRIHRNFHW